MSRASLSGSPGRLLVVALVLLTAGVGLCLFDGYDHHSTHGVAFDLCLGMALMSVALVTFTSMVVHPMATERPFAVRAISLNTPDPPPKPACPLPRF
jgi:hypothetical protein